MYQYHQEAYLKVLLSLAIWFLIRFSKHSVFPLKSLVLHLNKLKSYSLKNTFCQVWLKSVMFLEEVENVKSLKTDGHLYKK